jgi:putative thiamine transport system permease protein
MMPSLPDTSAGNPGASAADRPATHAARRHRGASWLGVFPALTLVVFVGPIAAGLLGTLLPAFGVLPALGGTNPTLQPWRDLFSAPGFGTALRLTLTTGFAATVLSLALTLGFCASFQGTRSFRQLQRLLAPLLAIPHAAFAIGLSFLVAPSGWIARLLSPWLTGWARPPDLALIQDPYGVAMTAALIAKEVPFLLLMTLAALGQTRAEATLRLARTLGYGPVAAWLKFVLPLVYRQVRLPLFAVLAYSLSTVEVALILGPTAPPPLAPLVLRWFVDADLALRFQAAAGALLQLGVVVAAIGIWSAFERPAAALGLRWIEAGGRGGRGRLARFVTGGLLGLLVAAAVAVMAVLAVWAVADRWRFPDALPGRWTLDTLARASATLGRPLVTTLLAGTAATLLALVLVVGCLEYEVRARTAATRRALAVVYLPLLVPQIGFLFGVQVILLLGRLDGTWTALVGMHLLFVLPYVFLSLREPYLALDPRYELQGRCLGRSGAFVFVRVKLPMLLRPLLAAAAVAFAVSVGQYLPTLFAGAGRLTTLNTYGPRTRPDDGRVVSSFIVQALTGREITIHGDGSQTRSFCYVDDLVGGLVRLMGTADGITGPVNLGNPGEFTMLELAEKVLNLTSSRSKVVFGPLPEDDPRQRRPDIGRARELLGWEPAVNLDEGLGRTIGYFEELLRVA